MFAEANTSVCGIPVFAHIRVGDELDGEVDGVLHFIDEQGLHGLLLGNRCFDQKLIVDLQHDAGFVAART